MALKKLKLPFMFKKLFSSNILNLINYLRVFS